MECARRVDESALTGESEDLLKNTTSDRFLRSGSRVLEGQGRLLVTAVGSNSQQGQIFGSLTDPADSLRYAGPSTGRLKIPVATFYSFKGQPDI